MVWSVLVATAFGCDQARTTSRAKGGEDAIREQRFGDLAKEREAKLQSAKAMERPAVEPAPPTSRDGVCRRGLLAPKTRHF